jgi:DNA helicase-2/ATP-dependent DNA helicase PcrA
MTRAKKQLYISIPKRRYGKSVRISRFVEELRKGIDYGSQVYIGQKVFHKIYFSGIVSEIIGKGDEERIRVDFGGNIRELNLKTCIKNEIIRFL